MSREAFIDWVFIPLAALLCVTGTILFFILWYEPHPIASYRRDVEPTILRPGDEVFIRSTVKRSKGGCTSHITRWFSDSSGNKLGAHERWNDALPAGHEEFKASLIIPLGASPGTLVLHVEVEFFCNIVQRQFGGSKLLLPDVYLKVEGL